MSLDVTYGNMTIEEAERLADAVGDMDDMHHEPGSTEPWISKLVASLVVARGARNVLETGCFMGATSVWLIHALRLLGGGEFVYCEIDPWRRLKTAERLLGYDAPLVHCHAVAGDVLDFLARTDYRFDVAFIDDDHTKKHVQRELELLYPKMNPGGLILLHDVFGVCDLQTVVKQWGGIALDFPRLGPAGGLGIIQVP